MRAGEIYKIVFDPRNYEISTWGDFRNELQRKLNEELDLEYPFEIVETFRADATAAFYLPAYNLKGDDPEVGSINTFGLTSDSDNWPAWKETDEYSDTTLYVGAYLPGCELFGDETEAKTYYLDGVQKTSDYVNCNQNVYCFLFDTTMWTEENPMYVFSFCRVKTDNAITTYPNSLYHFKPFVVCKAKNNETEEERKAVIVLNPNITKFSIYDDNVGGTVPTKTKTGMSKNIQLQKLRIGNYTFGNEKVYLTYDSDNAFVSASQYKENIKNATRYYQSLKTQNSNYKILLNFRDFTAQFESGRPVLVIKE